MRNRPHRFELYAQEVVGEVDGAPVYAMVKKASMRGIFSMLDAKEREQWESQQVEASARIPLQTEVKTTQTLRVVTPSHAQVAGGWDIATVRWSPMSQRLMLKRSK